MSEFGSAALTSLAAASVWAAGLTYLGLNRSKVREEQSRARDSGDPTPDPVLNIPLRRVMGNAETVDFLNASEREKAEREAALVSFVRTVATLSKSNHLTGNWRVETNDSEDSATEDNKGRGGVFWKKRYTLESVFPEWQQRWLPVGFVLGATDRKNEVQYLFSGGVSRFVVESDQDLEKDDAENVVLRLVVDLHDSHWRNVGMEGAPNTLQVVVNQSSDRSMTTVLVDGEGKSIPLFVSTFSFRLMKEPVCFGTDVWSEMSCSRALFLGWNVRDEKNSKRPRKSQILDRGVEEDRLLAGNGEQGVVVMENRGAHLTFLLRALPVAFPLDVGVRFEVEQNLKEQSLKSQSTTAKKQKHAKGVYEHVVRAKKGFGLPIAARLTDEAKWVLEMRLVTRGKMRAIGDLFWDASSLLALQLRTGSFDLTWDLAAGGWRVESLDGESRTLGDFGTVDLAVYSGVPVLVGDETAANMAKWGPIEVPLRSRWQSKSFASPLPGPGGSSAQTLSLVRYTEMHGKWGSLAVESLLVPSAPLDTKEEGTSMGLAPFWGFSESDEGPSKSELDRANRFAWVLAIMLVLLYLLGFALSLGNAVRFFASIAWILVLCFGAWLVTIGFGAAFGGHEDLDWLRGWRDWVVRGCIAVLVGSLVLSATGFASLGAVSAAFVVSCVVVGEAVTVVQSVLEKEQEDELGSEEEEPLPDWATVLEYVGGNRQVAEQVLEAAMQERKKRKETKRGLRQRRTSLVVSSFVVAAGLACVSMAVELRGMSVSPSFPGVCACPSFATAGSGMGVLVDLALVWLVWQAVRSAWRSDCEEKEAAHQLAEEALAAAEKMKKPGKQLDVLRQEVERLSQEKCEEQGSAGKGWMFALAGLVLFWALRPSLASLASNVTAVGSCSLEPAGSGESLPMVLQLALGGFVLFYMLWLLLGDSGVLTEDLKGDMESAVSTNMVPRSLGAEEMSCSSARLRATSLRAMASDGDRLVLGFGLEKKGRETDRGILSLGCAPSRDLFVKMMVGAFGLMWVLALASSGRRSAPNVLGGAVLPLLGFVVARNAVLLERDEGSRSAVLGHLLSLSSSSASSASSSSY